MDRAVLWTPPATPLRRPMSQGASIITRLLNDITYCYLGIVGLTDASPALSPTMSLAPVSSVKESCDSVATNCSTSSYSGSVSLKSSPINVEPGEEYLRCKNISSNVCLQDASADASVLSVFSGFKAAQSPRNWVFMTHTVGKEASKEMEPKHKRGLSTIL